MRLDVAVDDAEVVGAARARAIWQARARGPVDRQRPLPDAHRLQVLAGDVLEDDELPPLPLAAVDDRNDVGMREPVIARASRRALDVLRISASSARGGS